MTEINENKNEQGNETGAEEAREEKSVDVNTVIKEEKGENVSLLREYFELIAEVIIFVFFINAFLLQSYVIPSSSMENTMLIGDHLLVDKVCYSQYLSGIDRLMLPQLKIKTGMIVTFTGPNEINNKRKEKNLVKRVIATPGDTIKIVEEKVYINGKLLKEPYVRLKGMKPRDQFPPEFNHNWHYEFPRKYRDSVVETEMGKAYKIPEDHYFVMGDNRNFSFDSRFWGPLPKDLIIGQPWRVYWSFESKSGDYLTPGARHWLKDIIYTFTHIFSKTRWDRTFKKY